MPQRSGGGPPRKPVARGRGAALIRPRNPEPPPEDKPSRELAPQKAARLQFLMGRVRDQGCRRGELEEAVNEIRTNKMLVSLKDCTMVLSALGKRGLLDLAKNVLQDMKRQKTSPNVIVYGAAITACEKGKDWATALEIVHMMKKERVSHNVITYNAAISACEKGRQWASALAFFRDLQSDPNLDATEVTYGAIISACRKQWELALRLKDDMLQKGFRGNVIIWRFVIHACVTGRKPDLAMQMFGDMQYAGFKPDEMTCNVLLGACEQGGWWQQALSFTQQMKEEGFNLGASVYSSVIGAFAKGDESQRALTLFDRMRHRGIEPDAAAYAAAIAAYQQIGKGQDALELLQEAIKKTDVTPNAEMYGAAMKACEGRWEQMLQLLGDMRQRCRSEPDAIIYNSMIRTFTECQQSERALELVEAMQEKKLKMSASACAMAIDKHIQQQELEPLKLLYPDAIAAHLEENDVDQALQLLDSMPEHSIKAGMSSYCAIISACEAGRKLIDAERVFAQMRDDVDELSPGVCTAMLKVHSRQTQWGQVLALLDEMHSSGLQLSVVDCELAAKAYAKAGERSKAKELRRSVPERAEDVPLAADANIYVAPHSSLAHAERAFASIDPIHELGLGRYAENDEDRQPAPDSDPEESNGFQEVLDRFEKMRQSNRVLDENAYREAINACVALGDKWRARELRGDLRDMMLGGGSKQDSRPSEGGRDRGNRPRTEDDEDDYSGGGSKQDRRPSGGGRDRANRPRTEDDEEDFRGKLRVTYF